MTNELHPVFSGILKAQPHAPTPPTRRQRDEMTRVQSEKRAENDAANCERCQGSGEDPEGFLTQHRGPDDYTVDGPCRDCGGTGNQPAPSAGTCITPSQGAEDA